jgi:putative polyhydroxyalkanoate system protein
MPKMTIEQSHQLNHDEVRRRLETLQQRLAEKYGIEGTWVSDTEAKIKRTGASGSIRCEPGRVVVFLDLSFALTPVKSKVEHRVREELRQCLEQEAAGAEKPA